MISTDDKNSLELSRRKLLAAAGIYGSAATLASVLPVGLAQAAPAPHAVAVDPMAASPVAGLHLQFGADASSEVVVSWHTLQTCSRSARLLGPLDGRLEQTVAAKQRQLHRRQIEAGRLRLSCEDPAA